MGCALASQASETGSSPVGRSKNYILLTALPRAYSQRIEIFHNYMTASRDANHRSVVKLS